MALRFARDRDMGRLEATMARLDADAAATVVRPLLLPRPITGRVRQSRVSSWNLGSSIHSNSGDL